MQKSIGGLEQATQTLIAQQKQPSDKLDKLSHRFTAVIAVMLALGAILAFLSPFANTFLTHWFSK
jgi:hypothetical protein